MMRISTALFGALLSTASAWVQAEPTPFDGAWQVTLTCPPHPDDEDTKGYTHRFPAEVVDGELSATHGTEGEPGWHHLRGRIKPDGSAALRLDGIVNNEKYAINKAQRGKQYTYRVKAQFEPTSGSGQRLTGRVCQFSFAR
ncbi:MAG: hypothetical protein ABI702_16310 [Burkholderiales bacterium]